MRAVSIADPIIESKHRVSQPYVMCILLCKARDERPIIPIEKRRYRKTFDNSGQNPQQRTGTQTDYRKG